MQAWEIREPQTLKIGEDQPATVRTVSVSIVGGQVDVVTHGDAAGATLEIHELRGRPLQVTWDGNTLKVTHLKAEGENIWETLKRLGSSAAQDRARLSIAVPEGVTAKINTVSAQVLASGLTRPAKINTVSGGVTLDHITDSVDVNTVSGTVELHGLVGALKANGVSGNITVHRSRVDPVKLNTVSGDITLDLLSAKTSISSTAVSGDVLVRVPDSDGFDVQLSSLSGAAIVDGQRIGNPGTRGGGRLSEGNPTLKIKASSVSGDVVVMRATQAVEQ
ncbi:putative adhesin [Branchiibius hedensis]|uniref:Adhesin n=1 Tax=Branchiibius hedensis TaxID=672460 RepID=A0A2Y8ZLX2_9MICO|nr:DUF4097 family beta strand repeat-containing protein [Branchiibius hedensis]PWJ24644.1 putative adhesin [Branchiibius hedensis]SSA33461.1 Putative adhesin [Branchiibius hedensis]